MRKVVPGGRGFPTPGFYRKLKLVLFDVDGVLTDGRIVMTADGRESKFFDVKDGSAVKWLSRHGLTIGLLTGRSSAVVEHRARELGILPELVRQGAKKKLPVYLEMSAALGVKEEETAYVGDDLVDLPVLRRVGLPCCPADARPEVKGYCRLVTTVPGGRGAARAVAEWILRDRGEWPALMRTY